MGEHTHGKILPIDIEHEMRNSYLDYAMSVIVGRALPDVRDGLKPVHRRILYAMYELGMTPDKAYKKSARLVGEVLGKYHPHGDTAVYDAMVRMAQSFATRYPLVDGHGNFGSIDGDRAAAMRYTEARMSKITLQLLLDIHKDTVNTTPNFDETLEEPAVLPSRIPNLLINGSSGIAVGMATNIPPHNITEVIDAVNLLIDNPNIDVNELMLTVKGPDFPTGGIIMGLDGIRSAYKTGRGVVKIRAKSRIETMTNGKQRIIITEIPYQVNKSRLIEKIADLVKDKKVDGITDLRDESDRDGMRVVIELRRDVNPHVILNTLYKHTQLQETFGIIMLALVDNQPRVLNLKEVLYYYLEHQKDVIVRRTKFDLKKAEDRAHIVEGLRIALNNLDEVIKTIRASKNGEAAKNALIEKFTLSEKQAQAILDMRLQRLTALERDKLEDEYKDLMEKINYFRAVLSDENKVLGIIKVEINEVREKFKDARKTEISMEDTKIDIEDLIAVEDMVITVTHNGYIKRLASDTYRSQKRGGRGISAMGTKNDDFVEYLFITTTHHYLMFFTNKGKVYKLKVYEIPESGRTAKGSAIINILNLEKGEHVTAFIPVKEFDNDHYVFMSTRMGTVKKTALVDFSNIRKDGIIALNLDDNDELIGVKLTHGNEEIILGTSDGKAIRFNESQVRSMGRTARGVRGIKLSKNDTVVGMDAVTDDSEVLIVTENGFGKRTPINEYRVQTRGGKGIITIKTSDRNGSVIGLKVVREGEELMMISNEGIIIRLAINDISSYGRNTQGVRLMRVGDDKKLVALAKVAVKEELDDNN